MDAVTPTPTSPSVQLPSGLDAMQRELEAYPLTELIGPYLVAINAKASSAECAHIHEWVDACLARWSRTLDSAIASHPVGGMACLQRLKARLQADRDALDAARLHFKQLHLNLHLRAERDPADAISVAPKLGALNLPQIQPAESRLQA